MQRGGMWMRSAVYCTALCAVIASVLLTRKYKHSSCWGDQQETALFRDKSFALSYRAAVEKENNNNATQEIRLEPNTIKKQYKLTLCTMVKDSVKYLIEWITFHQLQGVDHFVIYDDRSVDRIYLIPLFFAQKGFHDLVEVFPATFANASLPFSETTSMNEHRAIQANSLNNCNKRMRDKTDWLLFIDSDEFVFAVGETSLVEELSKPKYQQHSFIRLEEVRFGSGGLQNSFNVWLSFDSQTGNVSLHYSPADYVPLDYGSHDNDGVGDYPLVIESHVGRMPFKKLDGKNVKIASSCFFEEKFHFRGKKRRLHSACGIGNGKALMRSDACAEVGIHKCLTAAAGAKGIKRANILTEIRLNHYFMRSKEEINELAYWKISKRRSFNLFDKVHFMAVEDTIMIKFIPQVRKFISQLIV